MKKAIAYILFVLGLVAFIIGWKSIEGLLVALGLALGYVVCMALSIKGAKKLRKYEEIIVKDATYDTSKVKFLPYAMLMNLPYYFIYFVVSLIPAEFMFMWFIAGLPCAFILAIFPLNMTCQLYSFLTGKKKLYWLIQVALAVLIWLTGRAIIVFGVLPRI